jgi:hypothetical protein
MGDSKQGHKFRTTAANREPIVRAVFELVEKRNPFRLGGPKSKAYAFMWRKMTRELRINNPKVFGKLSSDGSALRRFFKKELGALRDLSAEDAVASGRWSYAPETLALLVRVRDLMRRTERDRSESGSARRLEELAAEIDSEEDGSDLRMSCRGKRARLDLDAGLPVSPSAAAAAGSSGIVGGAESIVTVADVLSEQVRVGMLVVHRNIHSLRASASDHDESVRELNSRLNELETRVGQLTSTVSAMVEIVRNSRQ